MPKTKILIVEDDPEQRTLLQELLKSKGDFLVSEAGNGREGLDRFIDGFVPDLCLVDLAMPEMSGLELIRRLRRNEAFDSVKIVVASGSHDRKAILELAQLGISGYILKPYVLDHAYSIIDKALIEINQARLHGGGRSLLAHTLLVVDDDPLIRTLAGRAVSSRPGWELVEAADGAEGLRLLEGGLKPALCLVDAVLPELDGLTLVNKIRTNPRLQNLRVVAMSARSRPETVRAFGLLRVEAFLVKPFGVERLLEFMGPLERSAPSAVQEVGGGGTVK